MYNCLEYEQYERFFQSGSHGEPACVRRISQSRPHPSDPVPGSLPVHLLKGNLRASIESEELLHS